MIENNEYCKSCCSSPNGLRQAVLKNMMNYNLNPNPATLWLTRQESFKHEDSCPDINCALEVIDDSVFKEKIKDILSDKIT